MRCTPLLALVAGCAACGRGPLSKVELVDTAATVSTSAEGVFVEGVATLAATSGHPPSGETDRIWLDDLRANLSLSTERWQLVDLETELDGFPLAVVPGAKAAARIAFRGRVPADLGDHLFLECRAPPRWWLEASVFTQLRDDAGYGPELVGTGGMEAAVAPPADALDTRWLFTDLESWFGAPVIDAAGRTLLFTRERGILVLDPEGAFERAFGEGRYHAELASEGATTVVAGTFLDTLELGGRALTAPAETSAVFVARLDEDLSASWMKSLFDPPATDCASVKYPLTAVSVSPNGGIALAGELCDAADAGGGPLAGTHYVAALAADGSHRFSHGIDAEIQGIAATPDGGLVAIGDHAGPIDLGAGREGDESWALWIARWDGTGALAWSRRFPSSGHSEAKVRVDDAGDVILLVRYGGPIDLGAGPLGAGQLEPRTALAKLTSEGELAWAKQLADASHAGALAVALDGRIHAIVTTGGSWFADAPFDQPLEPTNASFLAEFDRHGVLLERHHISCGLSYHLAARLDRPDVTLSGHHGGVFLRLDGEPITLPIVPTTPFVASLAR